MKLRFLKIAAIILAATIGEGVFALPYIFYESGWLLGILYLAVLAGVVIVAHIVYLKTLERFREKERLLGLAKKYFGTGGFWFGLIAIVLGLALTLVAYLIIGPRFIELAFPAISPQIAFLVFWLCISIPTLVSDGRATVLEVMGVCFVAAVLLFVFGNALPHVTFGIAPAVNWKSAFLPFGIILLSLAGWTGVEPSYESGKKMTASRRALAVAFGTILAAILYILFVAGIFGSAGHITPDTLSGIANWVSWKRFLLAALGLFSIGTGSVPLSHELRNALEKDMRLHPAIARAAIILLPPLVVLLGFNQFIAVLALAGGCFIALQYLLILAVGRRALPLGTAQKFLLDVGSVAFVAAAVYEIYVFVVH